MAEKSKRLKIKKLQINLTNRWLYTLIAFFSLVVIGVFVYAVVPNPGHSISQIEKPSECSSGQFLKWTGSAWACANVTAGGGSLWSQSGSDIYYNTGNVGIGTTSPTEKLTVNGNIAGSGYLFLSSVYSQTDAVLGYNVKQDPDDADRLNTVSGYPTVHPQAIVLGPDEGIRFLTSSSNPGAGANWLLSSYEKMRIQPSGNIGIGTTSPEATVHIAGNLIVDGFTELNYMMFMGYSNISCTIDRTGIMRYIEDYCNGYQYQAKLQICMKTGDSSAGWKTIYYTGYGYCGSEGGGGGGSCFPAGTDVTMFDGSLKNIEDIKKGDYVLSYDEESDQYVPSEVNKLLIHTEENEEEWSDGFYNIITSDRTSRKVTGNHPVYTKTDTGWGYKKAEDLAIGDVVKVYSEGEPKEVYIIGLGFIEEIPDKVYNLALEKPNNYFAEKILVHNLKDIDL